MNSKITNLITQRAFNYSFEVTPNFKNEDVENFDVTPLFYSITWHARSHCCEDLNIAPLQLAIKLRASGKNVLLHLSCDLLKKHFLDQLLERLKEKDIRNLFVILGENFDPFTSDFKTVQELIKYIRTKTADYFCIGVSGYPQNEDKLLILKQKVDVGAEFIITQNFFEADIFIDFVKKCRQLGIMQPIFPGLFIFNSMEQLKFFTNLCDITLPPFADQLDINSFTFILGNIINEIKCSEIHINNFHFFTLNNISNVSKVIKNIPYC